ncbi:aldo/keto reductase [Desulforhopalus sp. 52FAK]
MTVKPTGGLTTIPSMGLGTWKSKKGAVEAAVKTALETGYRHIDCASIYNNEKDIGVALLGAIKDTTVTRQEIWVTSKLWNNAHAPKHVRPALERSLKNLQLDYLDLYLIHWPVAFRADITFPKKPEQFIPLEELPIIETWRAMEKMVKKGLCNHIGVSNFSIPRLKELQSQASIQPFVNQIELHPLLQQAEMVRHCQETGVHLTAYSPLGSAQRKEIKGFDILRHPLITDLSAKYQATPAQIVLAWGLQRGTVVIPKSTHPTRLRENFEASRLKITDGDMTALSELDRDHRFLDGAYFAPPGSPYSVKNLWAN